MHVRDALDFLAGSRAIFNDEFCHSSAFLTARVRARDRPSSMIAIYPRGRIEQRWSFRSLFTLLNDLGQDWGLMKCACSQLDGALSRQLKFYYADVQGRGQQRLTVKIESDWTISASISRPDRVGWDEWDRCMIVGATDEGTRSRRNLREVSREMVFWRRVLANLRHGGNVWINHAVFTLVDAAEFHPVVLDLGDRLIKACLPPRPATMFIFALETTFRKRLRHLRPCLCEATFCATVSGYLRLDLGTHLAQDSFETVDRNGERFSILRGLYISPWARAILADNEIDGLMLDTTWHIFRQYVTAILMAVFRNVGIPLGFAFGVAETAELYERHYAAFRELFGLDLSTYVLESDQGSALTSLCARHGQLQLFCLRHFLLSLKLKEFSLPVGNLVKCRSEGEFASLKVLYEAEFRAVSEARRSDLLRRTLRKAGLSFTGSEIVIEDEARFNAVSMWRRIGTRMPSTTNSLEATHGHLNEQISRRNPFWGSMAILYNSISDKTLHLDKALVHDFRTSLKRSRRRSQQLDAERMRDECATFQSSATACGCSETLHLASCYRTDIPCSHRYAMGADKPPIPEFAIHLEPSVMGREASDTHHHRDPAIGDEREIREHFERFACRQIRRFSHAKNKEAVSRYVDERLDIRGPSALDVPVAVHGLIARGISYFANLGRPE
jgi:hypothetical protein